MDSRSRTGVVGTLPKGSVVLPGPLVGEDPAPAGAIVMRSPAELAAGADAVYSVSTDGFKDTCPHDENLPSTGIAEVVAWVHRRRRAGLHTHQHARIRARARDGRGADSAGSAASGVDAISSDNRGRPARGEDRPQLKVPCIVALTRRVRSRSRCWLAWDCRGCGATRAFGRRDSRVARGTTFEL